ncbi:MAG: histidine phosphatase family protein [Mesorhizobium sp.]|nr:histidine phosphatase family protein [Mesorhizobium sp.]MCO5163818.1 histidine phosphatase family protein [Mesorhizobium sp.]
MLRSLIVALALFTATSAGATEAAWALLREGGHVVLLRHAFAPGSGEPANFNIEKCNTQRNLSDAGRQQARKIGALFAARAAPVERVLASRWCRTIETARLAFRPDNLEPFAALDPFAADSPAKDAQSKDVLEEIRNWSGSGNMVMVTHQENIAALTGQSSRDGEAVIVRPQDDGLHVLGRIRF